MIKIENLSPMLRMTDAEIESHIDYGLNGYKKRLTPMLRMTDAEIEEHLDYGLNKLATRRIQIRRKKRQHRYADDWERESDE